MSSRLAPLLEQLGAPPSSCSGDQTARVIAFVKACFSEHQQRDEHDREEGKQLERWAAAMLGLAEGSQIGEAQLVELAELALTLQQHDNLQAQILNGQGMKFSMSLIYFSRKWSKF